LTSCTSWLIAVAQLNFKALLSVKYKQVCRWGDVLEYFFAAHDFVELIQLAEEMQL
jgi:hypothetical protein